MHMCMYAYMRVSMQHEMHINTLHWARPGYARMIGVHTDVA